MWIFDKILGRNINNIKNGKNNDNIKLANMPKDKRLKNFYGMKSFAHYIGFAGEHLVVAKLLLRGINVAKPLVDDGVDLIAIKNKKIYSIQVKTGFLDSERNRYMFNLSAIKEIEEVAYIFVLVEMAGGPYNFLIIIVISLLHNH